MHVCDVEVSEKQTFLELRLEMGEERWRLVPGGVWVLQIFGACEKPLNHLDGAEKSQRVIRSNFINM